jgi:hypothetical protein
MGKKKKKKSHHVCMTKMKREREREPTGLDKATTFGFSNQKPLDN